MELSSQSNKLTKFWCEKFYEANLTKFRNWNAATPNVTDLNQGQLSYNQFLMFARWTNKTILIYRF